MQTAQQKQWGRAREERKRKGRGERAVLVSMRQDTITKREREGGRKQRIEKGRGAGEKEEAGKKANRRKGVSTSYWDTPCPERKRLLPPPAAKGGQIWASLSFCGPPWGAERGRCVRISPPPPKRSPQRAYLTPQPTQTPQEGPEPNKARPVRQAGGGGKREEKAVLPWWFL